MRRWIAAGVVGALFLGLVGLAVAQDRPGESSSLTFTARVVKSYKDSKLLHVKVEYVADEFAEPAKAAGVIVGQLVFVQVPLEAAVVNPKGKLLKREADDDDGWDAVKGKDARLEISTAGTTKVTFKGEDKAEKGTIDAHVAKRIQVIKD
jgi:hypothetical protein